MPTSGVTKRCPGEVVKRNIAEFDFQAFYQALDTQRLDRGLSWSQVSRELWELSPVLNEQRPRDHPFSLSPINRLRQGQGISCQHALFLLRWLGRTPESFLVGGGEGTGTPLPEVGPDRRLRWHLGRLYAALNAERQTQQLRWSQVADALGCTPNQLTGLRTARYATGMGLAMRIVGWLGRSASDFIYPAKW